MLIPLKRRISYITWHDYYSQLLFSQNIHNMYIAHQCSEYTLSETIQSNYSSRNSINRHERLQKCPVDSRDWKLLRSLCLQRVFRLSGKIEGTRAYTAIIMHQLLVTDLFASNRLIRINYQPHIVYEYSFTQVRNNLVISLSIFLIDLSLSYPVNAIKSQ